MPTRHRFTRILSGLLLGFLGLAVPPIFSTASAAEPISTATLEGLWYGEPVFNGQHGHMAIRIRSDEKGRVIGLLSSLDIDMRDFPIGVVTLVANRVTIGPLTIDYDPDTNTLSGVIPDAFAPVHAIPFTLRRATELPPALPPSPDAKQAVPRWTFDAKAPVWGGLMLSNGRLVFGTDAGDIIALDAMSESMKHWERGALDAIGAILLRSVRRLAAAGADFFVCPDNTAHLAFGPLERHSPIPYLHIVEVVASEAQARGFKRLGILGTRFTMDGPLYRRVLESKGIGCEVPDAKLRGEINAMIFDELVNGIFRDSSRKRFIDAIEQLAARGCDAVVLGCTEIPLIVSQSDSPLPVLDSTRLLARAAVLHALQD